MMVSKVIAGSVFAAGVTAAMLGAGAASASPGISFDPGTGGEHAIGFGDQKPGSGAYANADKGNNALAVSISAPAAAIAHGKGNNVVAIDGVSVTGPDTKNNNVVSVLGATSVSGHAHDNNVLTVGGVTSVSGDSHNNNIVNVGGAVESNDQGDAPGALSLSVCGTSLSGQADHITVSSFSDGLCGGSD
jgi:hypothetical protein